jgi:hypothetical protein
MHNVRIYFKRTGEFPFIWSVDRGSIRSQKVVKDFHIGKQCEVHGGHDFVSNIENSPKVFVSVKCDKMQIRNGEVYLT